MLRILLSVVEITRDTLTLSLDNLEAERRVFLFEILAEDVQSHIRSISNPDGDMLQAAK